MKQEPLPPAIVRAIAIETNTDPRTVRRVAAGAEVRAESYNAIAPVVERVRRSREHA